MITRIFAKLELGAFKLAQKAGTDIIPFTMLNTNKWAKRKFYLKPITVKIIFHPVIKYEEYKDLTTTEISEKVIEVINSAVDVKNSID
ncbi:MAG: lysophospholipid acyltransferase family protein [Acholeplasmataceae bacterium]